MQVDTETTRLINARKDALARGDKALGREIYHALQTRGLLPHQIDDDEFEDVKTEAPAPVETADVKAPLETAVDNSPRGRKSKAE